MRLQDKDLANKSLLTQKLKNQIKLGKEILRGKDSLENMDDINKNIETKYDNALYADYIPVPEFRKDFHCFEFLPFDQMKEIKTDDESKKEEPNLNNKKIK